MEDLPVGSSTQTIILSSPRAPVEHLGDAEGEASAPLENAFVERGFVLPGNVYASKKMGLVTHTSPEIYKAPNRDERNLYYEFSI
jgi:hypothetical protein